MCPICWINGLIAFLIGMGVLAIDSPYTPWLIGLAVVLTAYSMWKFHQGYNRWKGFSPEDARNLIVNGFCKDIFSKLPMEFAVEANKLLEISMEGSVG